MQVATKYFASVGFEATTMRQIASGVGVTLPTVYHYFGDKANLYLEVCMAAFAPRADRAMEVFQRSTTTTEQKVLRFFVGLATDLLEDENLFKLLHREMIDQDKEGIRLLTDRCWKQSFISLCAAFGELIPKQHDPAEVTLASFTMMFGMVEFRRCAPYLYRSSKQLYEANALTEFVLRTTVPEVNWSNVAEVA